MNYPTAAVNERPETMTLTLRDCIDIIVARASGPQPVTPTRATEYARRLMQAHSRAEAYATRYGFVGVGCISYADATIHTLQLRLQRRFG